MSPIVTIQNASWVGRPDVCEEAVSALESGRVLYIPNLGFPIEPNEKAFLADDFLQLSSKNVSYDPSTNEVRGLKSSKDADEEVRAALA